MKVKVSEADGPVLDWMVAKCEGYETFTDRFGLQTMFTDKGWNPSTNWTQAGPIIEREEISTQHTGDAAKWRAHVWNDKREDFWPVHYGSTPLIAAMRCFVCSKLGEVVEVPDGLA